jgi:hypothetical protein
LPLIPSFEMFVQTAWPCNSCLPQAYNNSRIGMTTRSVTSLYSTWTLSNQSQVASKCQKEELGVTNSGETAP